MMTLCEAHVLLPDSQLIGNPSVQVQRVHTDTRTLREGDLFVALRGERFDAHDYIAKAYAAGAVAVLAERGLQVNASQSSGLLTGQQQASGLLTGQPQAAGLLPHQQQAPGLLVPNSLQALQQLAAAWRSKFSLPLIAVTGSNGKTTVTQMLAAIGRAAYGEQSLATEGNLNNHIGVPLTLLRLRAHQKLAVVELGTNHVGEIAQLATMVQPTVALINNAQREHQEFLHGVEAVARENGSVLQGLAPHGTLVAPAADTYSPLWRAWAGARQVLTFALDAQADICGSATWDAERAAWTILMRTPAGAVATTLHQPGTHNVLNALAATACALAADVSPAAISQGLAAFRPVAGRSRALSLQRAGQAVTLIDDSYNANPDSVRAAIDVLADLPGPRWLVLGDMGEVGEQGPQFHAEVGAYARERGVEALWSTGSLCKQLGYGRHFETAALLCSALGQAPPAATVLVKGSRFMKMEQVVQALSQEWARAV
jgi:UDP-N-acetylmuramoyl-tripeptide--D-alanyl-D-alanine ligase